MTQRKSICFCWTAMMRTSTRTATTASTRSTPPACTAVMPRHAWRVTRAQNIVFFPFFSFSRFFTRLEKKSTLREKELKKSLKFTQCPQHEAQSVHVRKKEKCAVHLSFPPYGKFLLALKIEWQMFPNLLDFFILLLLLLRLFSSAQWGSVGKYIKECSSFLSLTDKELS